MNKYNVRGIEFIEIDRKKYCKIDQCGVTAIYPFDVAKTTFRILWFQGKIIVQSEGKR